MFFSNFTESRMITSLTVSNKHFKINHKWTNEVEAKHTEQLSTSLYLLENIIIRIKWVIWHCPRIYILPSSLIISLAISSIVKEIGTSSPLLCASRNLTIVSDGSKNGDVARGVPSLKFHLELPTTSCFPLKCDCRHWFSSFLTAFYLSLFKFISTLIEENEFNASSNWISPKLSFMWPIEVPVLKV